jgi:acyl-coenzyme A synthetase/AMP-(fatty) acid ligase
VPDEVLGARLVALVVGADAGLRVRARETLPAVKRPSKVLTVSALPKTANGKPDRPAALAEALKRMER